jgi:hypothetical protein
MHEMSQTDDQQAPPVRVARWGRTCPQRGRTQRELHCPCGHTLRVSLWSMAGNGGKRCPCCVRWSVYET